MIKAIQGGQVKLVLSEREELEIIMFHLSRSENSKKGTIIWFLLCFLYFRYKIIP